MINRLRIDLVRRNDMLNPTEILATLAIELLGVVPESEDVLVANGRGTPVAHEQRSLAARSYHHMARRLLGESVPHAPILKRRRGLLAWLRFRNRPER